MAVRILCVGKLKERWQRDACAEYTKRMGRYGGVEILEIEDLPEPAKPNEALERQVMQKEGAQLLRHIRREDRVIALCVQGEAPDSVQWAGRMRAWSMDGRRMVFVIGGSLGLSPDVIERADVRLSLSNMTLPHALARVVVLEQVYRAARINAGERYHK